MKPKEIRLGPGQLNLELTNLLVVGPSGSQATGRARRSLSMAASIPGYELDDWLQAEREVRREYLAIRR